MTAVSMTSPARSPTSCLSTVVVPSAATNSIRTLVAASIVAERSLPKKSLSCICATRVAEPSAGQSRIMRCGFFCANRLTDVAARRSELPSRSTGFTAEPSTLAKRVLSARSSSFVGSSG